jgi:chemotaxis protein methyltransferase CheR
MNEIDIQKLEVKLLLEAIFLRYGYDFRHYSRASITRRILQFITLNQIESISHLQALLIRDEAFFSSVAQAFSITVTEMFRDPHVYRCLRGEVIPLLKTYPFVKIWHAGCATGEEVYSLAILLKEEGLYERCTIFATDMNDTALEAAREGIYPLESAREYTVGYQKSGGQAAFSDYYVTAQGSQGIQMDPALRERVTFANHNLVSDEVFGEMNLIICRNVLIYFNVELKDRVLDLFVRSLTNGGILCLGDKESLCLSRVAARFSPFDESCSIYKLGGV